MVQKADDVSAGLAGSAPPGPSAATGILTSRAVRRRYHLL